MKNIEYVQEYNVNKLSAFARRSVKPYWKTIKQF